MCDFTHSILKIKQAQGVRESDIPGKVGAAGERPKCRSGGRFMPWQLSIAIDRNRDESLSRQIQQAIRRRIAEGSLEPGVRLPSTRQLSSDLGVSRSVTVEAYEQLTAEGFLASTPGSGTRVTGSARGPGSASPLTASDAGDDGGPVARWDLRPGQIDPGAFPRGEWSRCYRRAIDRAGPVELNYPHLNGLSALRSALACYLGRVRALRTDPGNIIVTSGFAQGLALLCEALPQLGLRRLAVEDPGHDAQRRFITAAGLRVVPVPVDDEGIDVAHLRSSGARAVLVTPAHQFPTGVPLSAARRQELVRWAEEVDGIVIEDDYDAEFWFEPTERPGAVQALAPDRVVYAGTASKMLFPGLRLGWLVLPSRLLRLLCQVRARRDLGTDTLSQSAFAEMIDSGMLDRHLRRARQRYRDNRRALAQAVELYLPSARLIGVGAGLHAYLRLAPPLDESELVAAAARRSVLVQGAARYWFDPAGRPPGLVVNYAAVRPDGLAESIFALADAADEQRRVQPARRT